MFTLISLSSARRLWLSAAAVLSMFVIWGCVGDTIPTAPELEEEPIVELEYYDVDESRDSNEKAKIDF